MLAQEDSKPKPGRTPRRPKHLKFWLVVGMLLVLWAAALFTQHILNTPAQGIVAERTAIDNGSSTERLIRLNGKTAKFQYPAQIQKLKTDNLAVGDIEKFLFNKPEHGNWSLTVLIKRLPSGVLAADGNYNLRKQNPQQYVEQTRTINGAAVSVMTDHSGAYNQVAFMPHGEIVAEVSLSGAESNDADSQAILNTVLNSWQWL